MSDYKVMRKHLRHLKDKNEPNKQYIRNVTKSVKTLLSDIHQDFGSPLDKIKNVNTFFRNIVRKYTANDVKSFVKKTTRDYGSNAEIADYMKNARQALKTGKLYGSQDEAMDSMIDSMMGQWLDDDDLDDDMSLDSFSSSMGSSAGDKGLVTASYDTASAQIESGISNTETLARVTDKQTGVLKTSLTLLQASTERQLEGIGSGISQVNNFLNTLQKEFNSVSLENQKTQITLLAEIRDLTKSGIEVETLVANANAEVKKSVVDYLSEGDFKGAFQKGVRNTVNEFDKFGAIGMIQTLVPQMAMMFKDNPFGFVKEMFMAQTGLDKFQRTMDPKNLMRGALTKGRLSDSKIISRTSKALAKDPNSWGLTTQDTSEYAKGKIDFDGVAKKSIVEVIPTYLRKILSALTRQDELVFDFDKGRFDTLTSMFTERKAALNKDISGQYDISSVARSYMDRAFQPEKMNTKKLEAYYKTVDNMSKNIKIFLRDLSKANIFSINQILNVNYAKFKEVTGSSISEDAFILIKASLLELRESDPTEFYRINDQLNQSLADRSQDIQKAWNDLKGNNSMIGNIFSNNSTISMATPAGVGFGGGGHSGGPTFEMPNRKMTEAERKKYKAGVIGDSYNHRNDWSHMLSDYNIIAEDGLESDDLFSLSGLMDDTAKKKFTNKVGAVNQIDANALMKMRAIAKAREMGKNTFDVLPKTLQEFIIDKLGTERVEAIRDTDALLAELKTEMYSFKTVMSDTPTSIMELKQQLGADAIEIAEQNKTVFRALGSALDKMGDGKMEEHTVPIVKRMLKGAGMLGSVGLLSTMIPGVGMMSPILAATVGIGSAILNSKADREAIEKGLLTPDEVKLKHATSRRLFSRIATGMGVSAASAIPAMLIGGPVAGPLMMAALGVGAAMTSEKDGLKSLIFGHRYEKGDTFAEAFKKAMLGEGGEDQGLVGKFMNPMIGGIKDKMSKFGKSFNERFLGPLNRKFDDWMTRIENSKFGQRFEEGFGFKFTETLGKISKGMVKGLGKAGSFLFRRGESHVTKEIDATTKKYQTGSDWDDPRLAGLGANVSNVRRTLNTTIRQHNPKIKGGRLHRPTAKLKPVTDSSLVGDSLKLPNAKNRNHNTALHFYSQYDSSVANIPFGPEGKTIKDTGCGPMAGCMVVSRLSKKKVVPKEIIEKASKFYGSNGVSYKFFEGLSSEFGLDRSVRKNGNLFESNEMMDTFKNGSGVIVALVRQHSQDNHFLVLHSYDPLESVITFSDPARGPELTMSYEEYAGSVLVSIKLSKRAGLFGRLRNFVRTMFRKSIFQAEKRSIAAYHDISPADISRISDKDAYRYSKASAEDKDRIGAEIKAEVDERKRIDEAARNKITEDAAKNKQQDRLAAAKKFLNDQKTKAGDEAGKGAGKTGKDVDNKEPKSKKYSVTLPSKKGILRNTYLGDDREIMIDSKILLGSLMWNVHKQAEISNKHLSSLLYNSKNSNDLEYGILKNLDYIRKFMVVKFANGEELVKDTKPDDIGVYKRARGYLNKVRDWWQDKTGKMKDSFSKFFHPLQSLSGWFSEKKANWRAKREAKRKEKEDKKKEKRENKLRIAAEKVALRIKKVEAKAKEKALKLKAKADKALMKAKIKMENAWNKAKIKTMEKTEKTKASIAKLDLKEKAAATKLATKRLKQDAKLAAKDYAEKMKQLKLKEKVTTAIEKARLKMALKHEKALIKLRTAENKAKLRLRKMEGGGLFPSIFGKNKSMKDIIALFDKERIFKVEVIGGSLTSIGSIGVIDREVTQKVAKNLSDEVKDTLAPVIANNNENKTIDKRQNEDYSLQKEQTEALNAIAEKDSVAEVINGNPKEKKPGILSSVLSGILGGGGAKAGASAAGGAVAKGLGALKGGALLAKGGSLLAAAGPALAAAAPFLAGGAAVAGTGYLAYKGTQKVMGWYKNRKEKREAEKEVYLQEHGVPMPEQPGLLSKAGSAISSGFKGLFGRKKREEELLAANGQLIKDDNTTPLDEAERKVEEIRKQQMMPGGKKTSVTSNSDRTLSQILAQVSEANRINSNNTEVFKSMVGLLTSMVTLLSQNNSGGGNADRQITGVIANDIPRILQQLTDALNTKADKSEINKSGPVEDIFIKHTRQLVKGGGVL